MRLPYSVTQFVQLPSHSIPIPVGVRVRARVRARAGARAWVRANAYG